VPIVCGHRYLVAARYSLQLYPGWQVSLELLLVEGIAVDIGRAVKAVDFKYEVLAGGVVAVDGGWLVSGEHDGPDMAVCDYQK
jgi:hypothetical protein